LAYLESWPGKRKVRIRKRFLLNTSFTLKGTNIQVESRSRRRIHAQFVWKIYQAKLYQFFVVIIFTNIVWKVGHSTPVLFADTTSSHLW